MDGEAPLEVTSVVDETPGIEVDQHSITVCRYARGLSKFETRWGTLTDPWTHAAAAEMRLRAGRHATARISSYDYDAFVTLQTRTAPAPAQVAGRRRCPPGGAGAVEYMLARIDDGGADRRARSIRRSR